MFNKLKHQLANINNTKKKKKVHSTPQNFHLQLNSHSETILSSKSKPPKTETYETNNSFKTPLEKLSVVQLKIENS